MKRQITIIVATLILLCSCTGKKENDSFIPKWYTDSEVVAKDGTVDMAALDPNKIDMIYLVSTDVIESKNEDGTKSYQSTLSAEDRKNIDAELAFAQEHFSQGDFNFLAPYYHQFTFEAIMLPWEEWESVYDNVKEEANDIMDFYINKINGGRKFVLVGFSQGAMLVVNILKHCTKEQLQNMVGAYVIGYGLNSEDLKCENIVPATGELGFGHTISFNSVMNSNVCWPFVYNNAATAINPVNWRTDSIAAEFEYEGEKLTVALDEGVNELIVNVPDTTPYYEYMTNNPAYKMASVNKDCLHHWDLLFYTQMIHDNIIKRGNN